MCAMEPVIVSPASGSNLATGTSISTRSEVESNASAIASVDPFESLVAPMIGASSIDPSEFRGHALGPLSSGHSLHVVEALTNGTATIAAPPPAANGHANGHVNGHANGHAHANGNANGYVKNGHANGVRSRLDVTRLAAAASVVGVAAPAYVSSPAPALQHAAPASFAPEGIYAQVGKRVLDIVGATVALVCFSPVIALAALAVRIDSRGAALYKSKRLGRNGREFTFYKLRSMHVGAEAERARLMHLNEVDGPVFKLRRDPRVTRVGQWLRSTSIDELPQIFNVLKGDMSLVGPRPPLPEEADKYEAWQRRRLDVKPGITSLWAISGRSRLGFDEWMRLDLEYIRRQSLATDLRILLRTIPAVLSREGAY
jgi:lipopolysaccharide/colanic/teichoic acid biosynthesis glycosyltransferase